MLRCCRQALDEKKRQGISAEEPDDMDDVGQVETIRGSSPGASWAAVAWRTAAAVPNTPAAARPTNLRLDMFIVF